MAVFLKKRAVVFGFMVCWLVSAKNKSKNEVYYPVLSYVGFLQWKFVFGLIKKKPQENLEAFDNMKKKFSLSCQSIFNSF